MLHHPGVPPRLHAGRLKKFLNFVGQSVEPSGQFLKEMRRAPDPDAVLRVCDRYMMDEGKAEQPFADEPYPGLVPRPNCESAKAQGCSL